MRPYGLFLLADPIPEGAAYYLVAWYDTDAMITSVRDAREMFPPAALPGPEPDMEMPSMEIVMGRYAEQIRLVVDR